MPDLLFDDIFCTWGGTIIIVSWLVLHLCDNVCSGMLPVLLRIFGVYELWHQVYTSFSEIYLIGHHFTFSHISQILIRLSLTSRTVDQNIPCYSSLNCVISKSLAEITTIVIWLYSYQFFYPLLDLGYDLTLGHCTTAKSTLPETMFVQKTSVWFGFRLIPITNRY